ncbi:MAG: ABC transporter substrate-binding protein [Dehalococcoidia bacterium]
MESRSLARRDALKVGGLGAAAAVAAAACGGDSGDDQESEQTGTAIDAASMPKRGGTLAVDSGEPTPNALAYAFNSTNYYIQQGVWDTLIIQGEDNRPTLRLAEQFEMKPDFTGVHIKLRQGVTYHSGRPLTAEDVRLSIEAFRADTINSQLKNPGKLITEITIADPLTLDITFAAPRPFMEDYFARLRIIDAETVDQIETFKALNGTGPFKFVSYTPNQGYVLERNPTYWQSDRPYLDRIQARFYSDEEAQYLALQSGELMHTLEPDYATVKRARADKNLKVEGGRTSGSWYAGTVVTHPVLKDRRVRQGLTFAVDRTRIAEEWAEGLFEPQVLPWAKESPAYIPEDEALVTYDPERARALLKEAGADGIAFPLDTANEYQDIVQYVQDGWKAIGLNVELRLNEWSSIVERFRARKLEASWATSFGFADEMHPATFFEFSQAVRIPNPSQFGGDEYKQLLSRIYETDPRSEQGRDVLHQWNKLYLLDDPWLIPLAPSVTFDLMRRNVIASSQGAMLRPPISEWWIDA